MSLMNYITYSGFNAGSAFRTFYQNLRIPQDNVETIRNRYKRITRQLNQDFWSSYNDTDNSLYVGSYGRNTDIVTSDIDILFVLPYKTYQQYHNYLVNGQSALLQAVRQSLQKTYPTSRLRGDGQVVVINFTDGICFEIVPCFEKTDGSFLYPDTHNGGSWKVTNPRPEIQAVRTLDKSTNGNMRALCRMTRAWKHHSDVPMGGLLIDTLACNFLKIWQYRHESANYHDRMSRDFFAYLMNQNRSQSYWYALGSKQLIHRKGIFEFKAKQCYYLADEAIRGQHFPYTAKSNWREIYGPRFPA